MHQLLTASWLFCKILANIFWIFCYKFYHFSRVLTSVFQQVLQSLPLQIFERNSQKILEFSSSNSFKFLTLSLFLQFLIYSYRACAIVRSFSDQDMITILFLCYCFVLLMRDVVASQYWRIAKCRSWAFEVIQRDSVVRVEASKLI